MYNNMKIAAIVVAGGSGSRMEGRLPKQYLPIGGKAMVVKTTEAFSRCGYVDSIIVVADAIYHAKCEELLRNSGIDAVLAVGGKERQDSVFEGLKTIPPDSDFVLIHDAARPFVSTQLIEGAIKSVVEKNAVVCAVPVKDTIRMMTGNKKSVTTDRLLMYAAQTPQAFEKNLIIEAYRKAFEEGFYGTDDASLAERAGYDVHIIPGSYENIKITTRGDMPAEREIRAGTGFDAHAFAEGRKLILGGVEIPFEKGLAGHSDADVLAHAAIDALLGACGCGDIGTHFPDSDSRYKNISSLLLLSEVAAIVHAKGFHIVNIDICVIAERPKIAPYRLEMAKAVANALCIAEDRVNVKGTTTEKLGFTGREEGIAAHAVCSIQKNQ